MNFSDSTILTYSLMLDEALKQGYSITVYVGGYSLTGKVLKHDTNAVAMKRPFDITLVKLEKIEALSIITETEF